MRADIKIPGVARGQAHLDMHFITMARSLMVLIMSFIRVAAWKVMKIIISWRQSSTHRYPMKSEQMRGRVKLFVIPLFDLSTLITLLDCASMCTASLIAILRRFSPTFNFFVWLVSIFYTMRRSFFLFVHFFSSFFFFFTFIGERTNFNSFWISSNFFILIHKYVYT